MKSRLLPLLSLGLLVAVPASAQFTGGDNFATDGSLNTGLWTVTPISGTAALTESVTGLYFSSAGGANDATVLKWNAPVSNGQDWSVGLNVYRPNTLPLSLAPSHVEIGLVVWAKDATMTGNIPDDMFSIAFDAYKDTTYGFGISTSSRAGGGSTSHLAMDDSAPVQLLSGVKLGISYAAVAQTLSAGYSTDGGATWIPVGTVFDTSAWASPASAFHVGILASSGNFAVIDPTSQVKALGFSANAIPEPSTYAALAGVTALGLVLLRRRHV
jgi:hypothetical protein